MFSKDKCYFGVYDFEELINDATKSKQNFFNMFCTKNVYLDIFYEPEVKKPDDQENPEENDQSPKKKEATEKEKSDFSDDVNDGADEDPPEFINSTLYLNSL